MSKDSTLHIRLENTLKKELEEYGTEFNLKLSNVIRIALENFVEQDHTKSTIKLPLELPGGQINLNAL